MRPDRNPRSNAKLWVITTYFNSENYQTRAQNYRTFIERLDECGVPCLTIECAFGDAPCTLAASDVVLHRRSSSVLWQKERLLNVALEHLPASCEYVAWIDADVIFDDVEWPRRAVEAMQEAPIIQLFDTFVRLPKGHTTFTGDYEDEWMGFCAQVVRRPGCEYDGWYSHGHTGFAWAARREVIERCSFFDLCLTGSGDHLMSHGFVGDVTSRCIDHIIGVETPLHREYLRWAETAARETGARVGFIPGRIYHLWHGDLKHRRYHERSQQMKLFGFHPGIDLQKAPDGCWQWSGANPSLAEWARQLFADRHEDGEAWRIRHRDEYDWPPEWRARDSN